ncbi:MAG: hypothetical protein H7Y11_08950, partial [Armatimonadetes bacterium]|nr:hypothetical protein [Anaerolineae bacterium]
QITDLSALPQVTADSALVAATQTAEQLLLTPGAVLTLTAASRELQGPVPVGGTGQPDDNAPAAATDVRAILPTFTYPPEVALLGTPAPDQGSIPDPQDGNTAQTASDDAALPTVPIVIPILALGGFGLLGLAVSTLRR